MKERLIGAAVLVALGVWLIPWLLDGPEEHAADGPLSLELPLPGDETAEVRTEVIDLTADREDSAVLPRESRRDPLVPGDAALGARAPAGDTAEAVALSVADRSVADAPSKQSDEPPADTSSRAAPPAAKAPAPESPPASTPPKTAAAPAPQGDWAVQLGSFGDEENARRLAERVATFGYKPQISDYRAGGRTMYRVRVGPHETRIDSEAVASALSAHGFVAQVVTVE